jgi:hypothetical protein
MDTMITHLRTLLPKWRKPARPLRIVRISAQSAALCSSIPPALSERGCRAALSAPDRLAIYPIKACFSRAIRLQQVGLITTVATAPLAAFYSLVWPITLAAAACTLGAAWYYHNKQEELMRRPLVRAARQADAQPQRVRGNPIDGEETMSDVDMAASGHALGMRIDGPILGGGYTHGASAVACSSQTCLPTEREPERPCLMSSYSPLHSTFLCQLRQTLSYLENPADPLQVRAAIKRAGNVAWQGQFSLGPANLASMSGIFFRGDRAFILNAGDNRVLLCTDRGAQRLTVDHGRYDETENRKRMPCRTPTMAAKGFSRAMEASDHPNAENQRPQVTSTKLSEAKNGVYVLFNAAVSAVIDDASLNDYVIAQIKRGDGAQTITNSVFHAAVKRHRDLGHDILGWEHSPAIMVIRPPAPGSPSTQKHPSPTLKPLMGLRADLTPW